ncbi:hypothetical protein WN943_020379 [Citrus x changshan-huyou]
MRLSVLRRHILRYPPDYVVPRVSTCLMWKAAFPRTGSCNFYLAWHALSCIILGFCILLQDHSLHPVLLCESLVLSCNLGVGFTGEDPRKYMLALTPPLLEVFAFLCKASETEIRKLNANASVVHRPLI